MNAPQRFRYPKAAIYKDYAQAAAGALIFGVPLALAAGNVYAVVALGVIVAMFVGFGVSTWRRHGSVIVVTDEAIATEGARSARISWRGLERVELRYFATRRIGGRGGRGEEGSGWMQLRLDGEGRTIRVDSALEGFDDVARRAAAATARYGPAATPATKSNFAALGMAPDRAWAEEA